MERELVNRMFILGLRNLAAELEEVEPNYPPQPAGGATLVRTVDLEDPATGEMSYLVVYCAVSETRDHIGDTARELRSPRFQGS